MSDFTMLTGYFFLAHTLSYTKHAFEFLFGMSFTVNIALVNCPLCGTSTLTPCRS